MVNSKDEITDGWYNGDDFRSSWSILWSCGATIFACTWTVLHLGIPDAGSTDRQLFFRKMRLLVVTAMAPEVITAYAFGELLAARRLFKQLRETGIAPDGWELAHAYYLGMGSLHILSSDGYEIPICLPTKTGDDWYTLVCNPVIIELMQLEKLKPQTISKRDIQDRNKADSFTKVFTLAQSSWFVFQSLARMVARLPISPLEVSALAYVFCTTVTYLCWWSKPKDVLTVTKLSDSLCVADLPADLQDCIKQYDSHQGVACHHRWKVFRLPSTEAEILAVIRQRWPALVGLITGIIFCCIHLSAWNFSFPTETEKILWWACSIASATVPLLSFIAVFLRSLSPQRFDSLWPLALATYCTVMLIYTVCRLILCVIMLTSMRYLPEGSFTSINWALRFPHI